MACISNRWAIGLSGEPLDLQEAAEQFCAGAVVVRNSVLPTSTDRFVLLANEFGVLNKCEDVYNVAVRLLNLINAILFINEPARKPLTISGVHERAANGNWGVAIFVGSANVQIRGAKAYAHADNLGAPEPPPRQTAWIELASTDDAVADVLSYLRGTPDWIDLYKAYEAMNADVNALKALKGPVLAWPPKSQISAFTRDAQLHRHSKPWCDKEGIKTENPMALNDASALVRAMTRAWIEWRL